MCCEYFSLSRLVGLPCHRKRRGECSLVSSASHARGCVTSFVTILAQCECHRMCQSRTEGHITDYADQYSADLADSAIQSDDEWRKKIDGTMSALLKLRATSL